MALEPVPNQQSYSIPTLSVAHSQFERDTSGFNRRVYHLSDGSEVFFRGREESVTLEGGKGMQNVLVGSASNWLLSPNEPQSIARHRDVRGVGGQSTAVRISASKTLSGVLEVACFMSPEHQEAQKLREEVRQGIYSQKSHDLLEELVACNLFGNSGFSADESHAEMLVIEALLGEQQAKNMLDSRVDAFRRLVTNKLSTYTPEIEAGQKALSPSELVCVHATRFLPEMKGDGTVCIASTASATDHKFIRNTVHLSLNHVVQSHVFGNWEDCPYVVISPFEKVIEQSGKPHMLNTVDTWWTLNPGEPLIMPEAHVIHFNPEAQGTLFDDSMPGITRVKKGPYLRRDRDELLDEVYEHRELNSLPVVERLKREFRSVEMHDARTGAEDEKITLQENELIGKAILEVATARTLCRAGHVPHSGGMWAWDGNSMEATAETTQLAAQMQVFSGNHSDSFQARAEGLLAWSIGKATKRCEDDSLVEDSGKIPTPQIEEDFVQVLTVETLRSLYEAGIFFGRCGRGDDS
ncbi:hypothetical protein EBR25_01540 [bacterium]|nr:hypothetical protein [bacterium]